MPQPTIAHLRDLVRSLNYVVSIHAAEELEDDNLTILDLESIILTGKVIEHQRDRKTREVKTVVQGFTIEGLKGEVIVKVAPRGKLFVLTIYLT